MAHTHKTMAITDSGKAATPNTESHVVMSHQEETSAAPNMKNVKCLIVSLLFILPFLFRAIGPI